MTDSRMVDAVPAEVAQALARLAHGDRSSHGQDYAMLLDASEGRVPWADAAWPQLESLLVHSDNRVRSIAGQLLARLAAGGASQNNVAAGLPALLTATRDPRFVTARHILQTLWMVGLHHADVRRDLISGLKERVRQTADEKNGSLIRSDIVKVLRKLFDECHDQLARKAASAMIVDEQIADANQARKLRRIWPDLVD